jgi:hypothetical protein
MIAAIFRPLRSLLPHSRRRFEAVVSVIADRSAASALARLSDHSNLMGEAEFRGYVRARAVACVRDEVKQAAADFQWTAETTARFMAAALERTVNHLVRLRKCRAPLGAATEQWRLRIAG